MEPNTQAALLDSMLSDLNDKITFDDAYFQAQEDKPQSSPFVSSNTNIYTDNADVELSYTMAVERLKESLSFKDAIFRHIESCRQQCLESKEIKSNHILMESLCQKFYTFKELIKKQESLENSSREHLEQMGPPAKYNELTMLIESKKEGKSKHSYVSDTVSNLDNQSNSQNQMTGIEPVRGLLKRKKWLPTEHVDCFVEKIENESKIEFDNVKKENRKLQLKVDALQKQITLIQDSIKNPVTPSDKSEKVEEGKQQNTLIKETQAFIGNDDNKGSYNIVTPESQNQESGWGSLWASTDTTTCNEVDPSNKILFFSNQERGNYEKEFKRLNRIIEEKEELLTGLRYHLKEICFDRYPIVEERDELRKQVDALTKENLILRNDNK